MLFVSQSDISGYGVYFDRHVAIVGDGSQFFASFVPRSDTYEI